MTSYQSQRKPGKFWVPSSFAHSGSGFLSWVLGSAEERLPAKWTPQAEARSLSRDLLSPWVRALSATKAEASLSCGWRGGSGQWSPLEAASPNWDG